MPHSSGGGSHSSGSHSSGGSSSHSSGPSNHTYKQYRPGCRTYVRYINNRPTYIYSNYDVTKKPSIFSTIFVLVFIIPYLFLSLIALFEGITTSLIPPSKLESNYSLYNTYVEDTIDIFAEEEEAKLSNELKDFYNITGVQPVLLTVDTSLLYNYSSAENYAYDLYLNTFERGDEDKWLLVYITDANSEWEDWYYEGMQGDNTSSIITETIGEKFTDRVVNNLTARSKMSIADSFIESFDYIESNGLMDIEPSYEILLVSIVMLTFAVYTFYKAVIDPYVQYNKNKDYIECPKGKPIEDTCDYCNGVYVIGSVNSCPHCGATLPAHDSEGKRIEN